MGWRQFQRDTGKTTVSLYQRHVNRPACRIVQFDLVATYPFKHYKVVEIPVQNAGYGQLAEFLQL
ncbi:hypothetical protein D3C78_1541170 [compost metagenome]